MGYRILAFVLLALFGLAVGTVTLDAGDKKGGKDSKKVEKKVEKEAIGSIEIYKNAKGDYRYRVKNEEGKTIAMPLPQMHWETKEECVKAIEELRDILKKTKPVEVKD